MTPTQKRLHEEHRARQARFLAAAAKVTPPAAPPPPPKTKTKPPESPHPPKVQPKVQSKQPVIFQELRGFKKSLDHILHEVCLKHGVDRLEIANRNMRDHKVIDARFEYFYRARMETDLSYERIGKLTGHDHTSVLHGARQFAVRNNKGLPQQSTPTSSALAGEGR